MALLQDLIRQIEDPVLRDRITAETDKLLKQKKFGLVFEEHLPECTPLYEVPVRVGGMVAKKTGYVSDIYFVTKIEGTSATCLNRETREESVIPLDELVTIAQFGEPIYPYLKPIDTVCNAPESDLWHALIEADNYHALQLLEYLYAGKVDCIYIDPPYNTGAKDWKYNNDYVGEKDVYRHSKWLSMLEKRFRLAHKLLNPKESVLIVTIDEKEYLHLGCLLEEIFPEATMQMVSITINPSGAKRDNLFSRADEYAFILVFGDAKVIHPKGNGDEKEVRWWYLRRTDYSSRRGTVKGGTAQFYPIYVDDSTHQIVKIGEPLEYGVPRDSVETVQGATAVFPVRDDGVEMNWGVVGSTLQRLIDEGVVRVSTGTDNQPYVFRYLSENYKEKIESGRWAIKGLREDGTKIVVETEGKVTRATTVWQKKTYDAGQYGTSLLGQFIGNREFPFPKSLYAVHDAIKYFIINKPNALIIDFFAGSGTTLNAVNLLNAEDNGKRRCILVTNNEVSANEAINLSKQGYKPCDLEWERLGIAQYITWPRTVCSIEGHDVNGNALKGDYISSATQRTEKERNYTQIKFIDDISLVKLPDRKQLVSLLSSKKLPQSLVTADTQYIVSEDSEHTVSILLDDSAANEWLEALEGMTHITDFYIVTKNAKLFKELKVSISNLLGNIIIEDPLKIPMANGFKANAAFFRLGFLDKTRIALGAQFKELLPVLWMKAGAIGCCPALDSDTLPDMLILPQNHFAVLLEEPSFSKFSAELAQHPEIDTVFIVTDSVNAYREMIRSIDGKQTYQLYRDYLDNFRINTGR